MIQSSRSSSEERARSLRRLLSREATREEREVVEESADRRSSRDERGGRDTPTWDQSSCPSAVRGVDAVGLSPRTRSIRAEAARS
jgi:hypothetical protein